MNTIRNIDLKHMLYNSGDFFLPSSLKHVLDKNIYMSQNYSFYISGWTVVHYLSGMLLGTIYLYLGKPLSFYYYMLFIIHTSWELWQVFIGMSKPWCLTGSSNLIDTFVDTLVFMFGTYITLHIYQHLYYITH